MDLPERPGLPARTTSHFDLVPFPDMRAISYDRRPAARLPARQTQILVVAGVLRIASAMGPDGTGMKPGTDDSWDNFLGGYYPKTESALISRLPGAGAGRTIRKGRRRQDLISPRKFSAGKI